MAGVGLAIRHRLLLEDLERHRVAALTERPDHPRGPLWLLHPGQLVVREPAQPVREQVALDTGERRHALRIADEPGETADDFRAVKSFIASTDTTVTLPRGTKARYVLLWITKLAENEGRTNDAMTSYLDLIRLGEQLSRGGVVIDKLVAFGAQRRAVDGLNRLQSSLSDADCRRALVTLEAVAARRERFSEVWKRDQRVIRQTDRRWFGVRGLFARALLFRQMRNIRRKMQPSFARAEAELDLMMVELALRRCFLDIGSYPRTLNDLSEKYLKAIPKDPFSNKGFVYRLQNTGYLLYSVGPNGKDDGGMPLSESKDKNVLDGDLVRRANLNGGLEQ